MTDINSPLPSADKGPKSEPSPTSQEISIDDFLRIDLRIGTVLSCERVEGSKKLLRFRLDDGEKERIILSGIAPWYEEPSHLVGEQVVFVYNLRPRKMMGEWSEGMILSATVGDKLRLLSPDEIIDAGAKIS